jgi:hypothetical protein
VVGVGEVVKRAHKGCEEGVAYVIESASQYK